MYGDVVVVESLKETLVLDDVVGIFVVLVVIVVVLRAV